jgi:transcriptional regulator of heat shock response
MSITDNFEMVEISARIRTDMLNYIEPGDTSYSSSEVEECMQILQDYLVGMEIKESKDDAMKLVEKTVLALNELNQRCQFELIETDQREDICEIIILAGKIKGFNTRDEDITDEWREW